MPTILEKNCPACRWYCDVELYTKDKYTHSLRYNLIKPTPTSENQTSNKMETWESGVNEIGEKEFLNSSFSSIVNIEAEDLAPINLPAEVPALANFKY